VEAGFITHYFGLEEDYGSIMRVLVGDGTVRRAAALYWGLRILRQDPWECLVSFLCSSTKNIAHIRVLIEGLCRAFGKPVRLENYQGYAFPVMGCIDDIERLWALGLGFRSRYVHSANQIVHGGYLEDIADRPYEGARASLMELPGVGEKIADCILLFSMGFSQAFPIDTWIKRGMEKTYFGGERASIKTIETFARERFGSYAGYAQQYLYHYWRMGDHI
jgi:N-glycosylase/DNA lyase